MKKKIKLAMMIFFCVSFSGVIIPPLVFGQEMEHAKVSESALFEGWLSSEKQAVEHTIARDIRHARAAFGDQKANVSPKVSSLKTTVVPAPKSDERATSKNIADDKGSDGGYFSYCKDDIKKDFKSWGKSGAVVIAPVGAISGGVVGSAAGPLGTVGGAVAGGAAGAVAGGVVIGGIGAITAAGMCGYDYLKTH